MSEFVYIDVLEPKENTTRHYTTCRLHTDAGCVPILIHTSNYEKLKSQGFFVRESNTVLQAMNGAIDNSEFYYKNQG